MAASTGKNNGTLMAMYIGTDKIAHLTSNDVSIEMATRDASTKDSAGWKESLEGQRSGSFNCEGYFAEDHDFGWDDFIAALVTARNTVTVRYSSENAGDNYISNTCWVVSLQRTAPLEETETFTVSLEWTGAPTIDVVV